MNDEPEGKFLYTETVKLYCILLYCILSQTHVTFCEYLVFHEFRRNLLNTLNTHTMNLDVTCILLLLNTLNKKVSQIYLFRFFIHSLLKY